MPVVLGIDLGTTNTCMAFVEGGRPRLVQQADGTNTVPSAVAVGSDVGDWLVGHTALRQRVAKPGQTIVGAKRLIGRTADEVQRLQSEYAFKLVGHKGSVGIDIQQNIFSVPEISAVVLEDQRQRAEDVIGQKIRDVVIAVPAHFNERQRQATRDAGLIAGLRVVKIISEPTAAAVAYGLGRGEGKRVLVFDLGGGTFDVTVIEVEGKKFQVRATGGDARLGGQDFDKLLVDYLADQFIQKHGEDPRAEPQSLSRLQEAAEKAKCELTTAFESPVNLPFLYQVNGQPAHLEATISRGLLEQLAQPLIARTIKATKQTLEDAGLKISEIDEVLLVGGMTRMPKIQQEVARLTGKEPSKAINPDEAVAIGAGVVGQWISEEAAGKLIDVVPLPLGLTLAGHKMGVLIEKNTPLPARATKQYTTSRDEQQKIKVHVRQGESENAKENVLLGAFNLLLADAQPKGKPRIDVTFELDENGILHVTAEETGAGRRGRVMIRPQSDYGGVEEDFAAAQQKAAAFDKARKQLAQVEALFDQLGRLLSSAERSAVESKLRTLRSAILSEDVETSRRLLPEVNQLATSYMERLRSGSAAGGG